MNSTEKKKLTCITGASGTGRTTFVNTLCDSSVLSKKICDNPEEAHIEEGILIKPVSVGKVLHIYRLKRFYNNINFWVTYC